MDQWFSPVPISQVVLVVKNLPANAGDVSSIPGLGRSAGVGNADPLQYSCLGNPTDRGAWQVTVHGTTNSWTQHTHTHTLHVDLQWRYSLNLASLFSSHSYLFSTQYQQCIHVSPSLPGHPTWAPFCSWHPYVCFLHLCVCFSFANEIVYTIFLDSTYMH